MEMANVRTKREKQAEMKDGPKTNITNTNHESPPKVYYVQRSAVKMFDPI